VNDGSVCGSESLKSADSIVMAILEKECNLLIINKLIANLFGREKRVRIDVLRGETGSALAGVGDHERRIHATCVRWK